MKASLKQIGRRARGIALGITVWLTQVLWGAETTKPWPLRVETPNGQLTVYQPLPESLKGDRLEVRAALCYQEKGDTNVCFGAAWLQAKVNTDQESQRVTVRELETPKVTFAPVVGLDTTDLPRYLKEGLVRHEMTFALPELQARLEAVERERTAATNLRTTPPKIMLATSPTALVVLDGPPQLRPLTNSAIMRVVNTPYAMLFDPKAKRYWLKASDYWLGAAEWKGPWEAVAQAPAAVAEAIPAAVLTKAQTVVVKESVPPRVVVVTEPTEMIVTDGEPTYTPVEGNELLYVGNTDSLVFLHLGTDEYYVALSGRWYHGRSLNGPWAYAPSDQLPPAFARIPPGSPKAEALNYIAGTPQAQEAVQQAGVPTIVPVKRDASITVSYEGAPQFQPVQNAPLQYATNTTDAVFLVQGRYYCCRDAVWYEAGGPNGPWTVATSVPSEVYALPPSNPHYNVKYVYVYDSTPQEVYVGYDPGYVGCYVYGPTVVYGTGWWYPGYYGPHHCWTYPWTFGFGFAYHPWCGWGVGFGYSYNWLSFGFGWGWGRHYYGSWWGPCGAWRPYYCAPYHPYYSHGGFRYGGYAGSGHWGPRPGDTPFHARMDWHAGRDLPMATRSLYARPGSSVRGAVMGPSRLPGTPVRRAETMGALRGSIGQPGDPGRLGATPFGGDRGPGVGRSTTAGPAPARGFADASRSFDRATPTARPVTTWPGAGQGRGVAPDRSAAPVTTWPGAGQSRGSVADRPAGAERLAATRNYSGTPSSGARAESRFSGAPSAPSPNYTYRAAPSSSERSTPNYAYRGNSSSSSPAASSYSYRSAPSPSYRPAAPSYSAPSAPSYSYRSAPAPSYRSASPSYSAPSAPSYSSRSAPSYSAPSAPSYSSRSAPSYSAPSGGRGGGGGARR